MLLSQPQRDPEALSRLALTLVALLLAWPALRLTEFNPMTLFDARNRQIMAQFAATFFPLNLSPDFLMLVLRATLETLALATAGTALAMFAAFPLALVVARSLSIARIGPGPGRWLGQLIRIPTRILLIILRSVPEIVWALLFVRAVGLGPAAGVLAIAVTYAGMLGKVYSEILEAGDTRPARALLESGSGRFAAFCYGILPGALHELVSYSVYRWECAVRASVVMGFVGAGGLGQMMELSLRMLNGGEVSTILLMFLILVLLADAVSAVLRKALA
ncbi:MAG TPA: ABC transporter permease subunit [Burkholderiales bacterium]|nr:ABC transporter permease subunit [Burkholderiales bacterium]